MHTIRILGLASGLPTEAENTWVKSYTPDGFDGRGELVLTDDISEAKHYESAAEAMEDWRRTSATHPVRPGDGRPNRPMTAFSVNIERLSVDT